MNADLTIYFLLFSITLFSLFFKLEHYKYLIE